LRAEIESNQIKFWIKLPNPNLEHDPPRSHFYRVDACGFVTRNNGSFSALFVSVLLVRYWPSFNGAYAEGAAQHRVIINTVLSLCASALVAVAISDLHGKGISMEVVQNATLAGGVAVGTSADFVLLGWGACLIGAVAGALSALGFIHGKSFLVRFGIPDTCGVAWLHGMPGVLGGIAGACALAAADDESSLSTDTVETVDKRSSQTHRVQGPVV
jgi:ammonium transporter Rh